MGEPHAAEHGTPPASDAFRSSIGTRRPIDRAASRFPLFPQSDVREPLFRQVLRLQRPTLPFYCPPHGRAQAALLFPLLQRIALARTHIGLLLPFCEVVLHALCALMPYAHKMVASRW